MPQTSAATATDRTSLAPDENAASSGDAAPRSGRRVGWYSRAKFETVRWVLWLWVRMFSLRGLYLLAVQFGTLEYLINFKRRGRYRKELAEAFPEGLSDKRQQQIIRSYFQRTRADKLFYLIFDKIPKDKILRRIKFHGQEHLDEALARGKGVYVMLSHHGSHHVAGLLMALLGYRCAGIRDRNEGALRVYMQQRYAETFPEFRSIRLLYADSFPRDIFRCFQENRVVGSALDVNRFRGEALKTVPVQIFGRKREFLIGTLQIALRCNATIVQAFVVSRRNFYFRLICHPPLHVPNREQPADIGQIMQAYADGIASHVREHPDHLSRI